MSLQLQKDTATYDAAPYLTSGDLVVTSSDPSIVSVNGTVLSVKKAGNYTIKVSLGGVEKVSMTYEAVEPLVRKTATVEELITAAGALLKDGETVTDNKTIYTVSGYAADIQNNVYGDFELYNADFTKDIEVYGICTSKSCFEVSSTKAGTEYSAAFTNAKDFVYGTTFQEGDYVTLEVQAQSYKDGTSQLIGWVDTTKTVASAEHAVFKATAEVNEAAMGTAVLAKSEGLYIGEETYVTVTPATGYKVDSVKFNDKAISADATDATKYPFTASYENEIEVSFVSAAEVKTSMTLDVDSLALPESYADGTATVDSVAFTTYQTANYGTGMQMRYKDSKASKFYNTTALSKGIKSVVMTFNAKQSATKACTEVYVGDTSEAKGETYALTFDGTNASYTFTPAVSTYKFISVEHTTTSGAVYIDSVVINYAD